MIELQRDITERRPNVAMLSEGGWTEARHVRNLSSSWNMGRLACCRLTVAVIEWRRSACVSGGDNMASL